MSGRDQENAYFYELNKDLIDRLHAQLVARNSAPSQEQTARPPQIAKSKTFYDFLYAVFQLDEDWLADL